MHIPTRARLCARSSLASTPIHPVNTTHESQRIEDLSLLGHTHWVSLIRNLAVAGCQLVNDLLVLSSAAIGTSR
jgi:hypothetical protein